VRFKGACPQTGTDTTPALYDLTTPPPPEQSLILYERDPGGRLPCDPPVDSTPIVLR